MDSLIGSREWGGVPKLHPKRIRGFYTWEWKRANRYLLLGNANTGKSNLIEVLAYHHPHILDIHGSKDNEGLCWIRKSSGLDDALLICGDNTDLKCSWPVKHASDVTVQDFSEYEIVISAHSFYSGDQAKNKSIENIADQLDKRLSFRSGDIIFMAMRETNNILYSRLNRGVGEKTAKADLLEFIREMRHFGVSIGADMLQWTGTDRSFRDIADYMLFKNVGEKGLPPDKRYLYSFVSPVVFRRLRKDQAIGLKSNGDIAAFTKIPLCPFHKEEGVNLLQELGIEIDHGEDIIDSTSQKVGDKEHLEIIKRYRDVQSTHRVAKSFDPPKSSSTINRHIHDHDSELAKYGKCSRCDKIDTELAKTKVC
jgi:hypothetical protein